MRIRTGTQQDIESCVELALGMIKESWWKSSPFCSEKMREHALKYLHSDDHLFLVAEEANQVWGFFSAKLVFTFFGSELNAEHDLMFMHPQKRNGISGIKFLREYDAWAQKNKVDAIYFGPTATQRRQWDSLCLRLGYTYLGPNYGKRFKDDI